MTVMLVFAFIFFTNSIAQGAIYITDGSNLLELKSHNKPCKMHQDRGSVNSILRTASAKYVQRISASELKILNNSCTDQDELNRRGGFIYPGTKWCGPGNSASSYNELGALIEEDKCCREHDHCPDTLEPGQCKQGVCNISPFTKSHCDCDEAFKKCLLEINSQTANVIGSVFFNLIQVTCFQNRRPCPHYMREDPSYTWFCEEWKFSPSGEFVPTLLPNHSPPPPLQSIHGIPDELKNVKPAGQVSSVIDGNLQTLFEKDPTLSKVMANSKPTHPIVDNTDRGSVSSIFNTIPNGKEIWRD